MAVSVTREKEPVGIQGVRKGGGAFNEVDRKASEEVKAEQGRRSGNSEVGVAVRLVERSEMRNKLKEREVKEEVKWNELKGSWIK